MNYDYQPLKSKVTKKDIDDFRKKYKKPARLSQIAYYILPIIIITAVGFQGLCGLLNTATDTMTAVMFIAVFILFIVFIPLVVVIYNDSLFKERVRFKRFADSNGLQYEPDKDLDGSYVGLIFGEGHTKRILNSFVKNDGNGFEIANYQYCTGSGKNRRTNYYGYIMIELERQLPHIVLDSKENNSNLFGLSISNLPIGFDKDQILSLEGDFDKHFTLYAPKKYERDALYVFTPDLMELFIDEVNSFDAEIVDNKLFIYCKRQFDLSNQVLLKRIFEIIEKVGKKAIKQTDNYADERVGARGEDVVSKQGRRLKRGLTVGAVISTIVAIIYTFFWVISMIND